MIISVSRRTDIPAFYMTWLMERVRERKAFYYNPFSFKGYEVSLRPEDVDVMVMISKNYTPMLPYLAELQSLYRLYFHFTITGLSGIFEERVSPIQEMVKVFQTISKSTSPQQIEWRFDPIVLTNITPPEFYLERFEEIASQLAGYTNRCYFSFATVYDRVKRAFKELERKKGVELLDINLELQQGILSELAKRGEQYGIRLYSCCNDLLVDGKILKGKCIDGEYLNQIFHLNKKFPAGPTRESCGCAKSIDLGVYDTCPQGCSYCYANFNKTIALKNYSNHSVHDEVLLPKKIQIVKRLAESNTQFKLF